MAVETEEMNRTISGPMARSQSETFALLFRAFTEASNEVQEVIRSMTQVVNDPEVDPDDREAALDTLVEALFPASHNGNFGIDLEVLRRVQPTDAQKIDFPRSDQEETVFAERLRNMLDEQNMSQAELASRVGVQQPAISMMLNRKCRPQRLTVQRIAEALGVEPVELWPGWDNER